MPAASRIGDTHKCSYHVGGEVITGCPTVFIGQKPAARVTRTSARCMREPASQSICRLEWWMAWKLHRNGTWWKARCTQ